MLQVGEVYYSVEDRCQGKAKDQRLRSKWS